MDIKKRCFPHSRASARVNSRSVGNVTVLPKLKPDRIQEREGGMHKNSPLVKELLAAGRQGVGVL